MIVADTDVLIDYLAGTHSIADQVKSYIESDRFQTTAVSCFELLSGAGDNRRGDEVRRLLAAIPVLALDREGATQAAIVRQQLSSDGLSIGMGDSLIAGIALANDLPLFTRNLKHFENVRNLDLIPAIR
ncbi:MAG TPA: type II toxin-antitoxin system VapC family toxin [Terriglobales bacterium]|nr:type II toxin-antitoxin system VapC family toxin [Terriglobales bacterium]